MKVGRKDNRLEPAMWTLDNTRLLIEVSKGTDARRSLDSALDVKSEIYMGYLRRYQESYITLKATSGHEAVTSLRTYLGLHNLDMTTTVCIVEA